MLVPLCQDGLPDGGMAVEQSLAVEFFQVFAGGVVAPFRVAENRFGFEGLLEVGAGFFDFAGFLVEQSARGIGGDVLVVDFNGARVILDCRAVVLLHVVAIAAIAVGQLNIRRIIRHRPRKVGDRIFVVFIFVELLTAVDECGADVFVGRLTGLDNAIAGSHCCLAAVCPADIHIAGEGSNGGRH